MTIQTLLEAWKVSGAHHSMNPPATEAEIQAAEKQIGTTLPQPLREVYPLFNGGWALDLPFFWAAIGSGLPQRGRSNLNSYYNLCTVGGAS